MIKTEKNENIQGFFNVFAFGKLVDQVQGRVRANACANELAKDKGQTHFINHRKQTIKTQ